jgi:thimet oligopeptidase
MMKFDAGTLEKMQQEYLDKARDIFVSLEDTETQFTDTQVLNLYNDFSFWISDLASLASLLSSVHCEAGVREKAEFFEAEVNKLATESSLSKRIFELFSKMDISVLDDKAKRYVDQTLKEFRRSGVDKDEAIRAHIQVLSEELVLLGQNFSKNIRDDIRGIDITPDKLAGLPQDYIASHPVDSQTGMVKITTNYPDVNPFLKYADDSESRKKIYFEFLNRAVPHNKEVLETMLKKRYEMAHLLGYNSWADYVAEEKMTKTSNAIEEFIMKLDGLTLDIAKGEYTELLEIKKQMQGAATIVEEWERSYLAEKLRQQKYDFDSQTLRPYFEYHAVKNGLLGITSELYGIVYKKVNDAEVWHDSVEVYDVVEGDRVLGRIYLDMHPRDNKYNHAAQFSLKTGVSGRQLPEGVLVCNFTDPEKAKDGKALLSYDEVTTFFHEFGHLLHYTFAGRHMWVRQSGLTMEWDFVEAPSQFFEEWVRDPDVLARFAKHVETGESIPRELVEKMRASQKFGNGLFVRQQVLYSALALSYYLHDPRDIDTHEVVKKLQLQYSMFPHVEGTHFELSFGHLDGYTAAYYTYMWSLSISKDLLTPFKEGGMMNHDIAMKYRREILERGGTMDAADQIRNFLGRDYTFNAFGTWLSGDDL